MQCTWCTTKHAGGEPHVIVMLTEYVQWSMTMAGIWASTTKDDLTMNTAFITFTSVSYVWEDIALHLQTPDDSIQTTSKNGFQRPGFSERNLAWVFKMKYLTWFRRSSDSPTSSMDSSWICMGFTRSCQNPTQWQRNIISLCLQTHQN